MTGLIHQSLGRISTFFITLLTTPLRNARATSMSVVRERRKSGYPVSTTPPFLHLLPSLPVRNWLCCLAASTAGLHPRANKISSLPPQSAVVHRHNARHPTPMHTGKFRQREDGELRSCKDELAVLGETPSHRREIGRLTTSVSGSGNSRGNSEGTAWFPRGWGYTLPVTPTVDQKPLFPSPRCSHLII